MASKKEMLATFATYTGVTRLLESIPGRPSLLILNYHRVGDPQLTPYDSATFSCTAKELDWQVSWLKRRYQILPLPDALDIIHGRTKPKRTSVLITFDDGYRDNYLEAFPVLHRHGASATFFLPTTFIGSHSVPWWDEIAYMVKLAKGSKLTLTYPAPVEFDLAGDDRLMTVMTVLRSFTRATTVDTEQFLDAIAVATGVERPGDNAERCFMTWDEAREMQAAGMCFGSHTHTHEILGRLPYERQVDELRVSRQILEAELGVTIDTLAYPRGRRSSFSEQTFAALRETNYTTAFSFYSGVNLPDQINPLDVLREAVEMEGKHIFRLRHSTYAALGRGVV